MIKGFRQPAGGLAELDRQYDCACDLITVGRRKEAETLLCGILKKYPSHFGALCSLGAIRLEQAQVDEAMQLFRRAASYRPGSAEAHESLGNALQAMGRHEEAVYSYRRALNLRPQSLYTHNNLANSYMALGKLAEAVECLRQTIALLPGLEAAHSNLGNVLLALGRPEEALAAYQAALSLNPGLGGLHNNFGRALVALNRHEEALRHFVRARDLDPGVTQAPLNVALARLALGDYAAAWPDYETRWQSYPGLRTYAQPFWDGCADLAGKTILVYFEQGLGDTMQFARYVPLVAKRGARVIFEVPKTLMRLFGSLPGGATLLEPGGAPPDFDFHAPLLSLPLAFKTTVATIPAEVPYLHAAPLKTTATVGLCWAGNPSNPNDGNRSIPLQELIPLLDVPGARFLSLQRILREGDQEILPERENVDLESDSQGADFADTARLIAGLDLVITADTAIAHLAGALGRPTWVLLPFAAHWAWMRDCENSPWYPTVRLFRQPRSGDWRSVTARVVEALSSRGRNNCRSPW